VRTYPDDLAIGPIDLVNCACVTSGDEIIPTSILVNAIDVIIIPSVGAVVA
jgi:vacuolar-type H+-ATPase subunit D/Vma8